MPLAAAQHRGRADRGLAFARSRLLTAAFGGFEIGRSSMAQPRLKRHSAGAISVDTNIRCLRIYPTEATKRTVAELQTVGIRLSKDQAIHLARVLLVVTQEWEEVDITAYRFEKRQEDGTYRLTITSSDRNAQRQK